MALRRAWCFVFGHARAMRRKQGFFLTKDLVIECGADGYMVAGTWGAVNCKRCLAKRRKRGRG